MGVSASTAVPANAKESPTHWAVSLTGARYVTDNVRTGVSSYAATVGWEPEAWTLMKKAAAEGSGPIKIKIRNPSPIEMWGPFPKKYAKTFGVMSHVLPEKVDDVPVLTRCRHIRGFMRDSKGELIGNPALQIALRSRPGCWDDTSTPFDFGGQWYVVMVNHPSFYLDLISTDGIFGAAAVAAKFVGGKRSRRTRRNRGLCKKRTLRTKRSKHMHS